MSRFSIVVKSSIRLACFLLLALLAGCSIKQPTLLDEEDGPGTPLDPEQIQDAVARPEKPSKYGNPESYVVFGKRYFVLPSAQGFNQNGTASWYGKKFHGRRTSSGEVYDMYCMTAAHKNLPLPTYVEVTNLSNGKSTIVRVNDRGPFHEDRIIDLSYAAATKLGFANKGTAPVRIRAINLGESQTAPAPRTLPQPVESTTPTKPTTPIEQKPIFVQAGAFASEVNARRQAEKIADLLNRNVQIEAITEPSPLFRVKLGPFATIKQADELAEALKTQGVPEAKVILN